MRDILEVGDLSFKILSICNDVIDLFNSYGKEEDSKLLSSDFTTINAENKVTIAFIGQYNAGKSSIIKALTGNKYIKVNSDVTTDVVTPYDWGDNVALIDTPGIRTGENQKHDELALQALERSDLIVYCITSDLFNPVTIKDFKVIASKYPTKIFLVINKYNSESSDCTPEELIENYISSIDKALYPEYSIRDFPHFFIEAKDYLKGIAENSSAYIEDSNFTEFIEQLNRFIDTRGYKGKLLTPINLLISYIDSMMINLESDEYIVERKRIIKDLRDKVEENKGAFSRTSHEEIRKAANKYLNHGNEIVASLSEQGYEFNNQTLKNFSVPLEDDLIHQLNKLFKKYSISLDSDTNEIIRSEMAQHYFKEQRLQIEKEYSGSTDTYEKLSDLKDNILHISSITTPKLNDWLKKAANISEGEEISIWSVKGSSLSKTIKAIGTKIGYKFKPYEVLKITEKIAKLQKFIDPVLTGVGTIAEIAIIIVQKYGEAKLKECKKEIKTIFQMISEETITHYHEQVSEISNEFDNIRDCLEEELSLLEIKDKNNSIFFDRLKELKSELLQLRIEIEKSTHKG